MFLDNHLNKKQGETYEKTQEFLLGIQNFTQIHTRPYFDTLYNFRARNELACKQKFELAF